LLGVQQQQQLQQQQQQPSSLKSSQTDMGLGGMRKSQQQEHMHAGEVAECVSVESDAACKFCWCACLVLGVSAKRTDTNFIRKGAA
jgi:hypothetical protein